MRGLACIELLCCEAGCEPAKMSEPEWQLLFKFAERFVPAFQPLTMSDRIPRRGRPVGSASRNKIKEKPPNDGQPIDREGYLRLLLGIGQRLEEGRPRWKSGLAKELATNPYFSARGLTRETIGKYIDDLLHALRAPTTGQMTSFRRNFLEQVLPYI